jgi:DNA (cytosine-5)-methyltransferase 1
VPRPIAVDLFSGVGGMSLGFEQAGFDIRAAVEIDPVHCAAHKFNFPDCPVVARSVAAKLTGKEIRKATSLGNAKIDCVFGGPPCQGFSAMGHRYLRDPRNAMVAHFVRLVFELDAQTFVFENVKGLTFPNQKDFLDELVDSFDDRGYNVRLPWRILNAANFGVPQHRERLILIGAKKGLRLPNYPKETTVPADDERISLYLPVGPTCRDALGDLPDADHYGSLTSTDNVHVSRHKKPSLYAAEMRCLTKHAWHYGYVRKWDPTFLTCSSRTEHTAISRRRFAKTLPGSVEPVSRFYKLSAAGLSNTLRAGTDAARGSYTSPRPIHYKYPRCITVREMARLHGFPDWFRFNATIWHGAREIGNAVPPPLARAIATELRRSFKIKPCSVRPPSFLWESSIPFRNGL